MTSLTVHVTGISEALGLGFDIRSWFEDESAELTTDHARSSFGQAVLVKDGKVYGPGDLPGVTIHLGNTEASGAALIEPAKAAGWNVRVQEL